MGTSQDGSDSLVISYLTLRSIVGILGLAFPFLLAFGQMIVTGRFAIERSISAYYHTEMGDVFVGTLCVIGFFLLSYRGYERKDDVAGDLACLFAVGTALFPTTADIDEAALTATMEAIGGVHFGFAAAFFLTLTYFSLHLFTKTGTGARPTRRKLLRNRVYRICGYTMSVCILLMALLSITEDPKTALEPYNPVFWLESIAVVAFGFSWLTKGEAILADEVEGDQRPGKHEAVVS